MTRPLPTSLLVCLLGVAAAGQAPEPKVDPLEALCQKLQKDPGKATEADARQALELARKLGRPMPAAIALKSYLAQHFDPSPTLAILAAENALHVGDYRTAVSRYKTALKNSRGGAAAADTAAMLYMTLLDFLGADDDAYQYMDQHGAKFRRSVTARKFDRWLLDAANRRRDYVAAARRLAAVLGDRMPIEQERLYCWDHLDWIIEESAGQSREHYDAIPYYRQIVPLIRDGGERGPRLAFHAARLAFEANAAGKDRETLDADYGEVVKAARAFFDAHPTAENLRRIVLAIGGNPHRFDEGGWRKQETQNRAFFVYAFSKLNDAGREAFLKAANGGNMASRLASASQWAELGARHAAFFRRSASTRTMPFAFRTEDRALLKKQASFLGGTPSVYAAIINALAASDDLTVCLKHLAEKESWHLGFGEYQQIVQVHMWTTFRRLNGKENRELGQEVLEAALVQFGAEHLAKSPIVLFDPAAARSYIQAVWNRSGADSYDKSKVAPALRSLDWVPYTAQERRTVFQPTYDAFRRWASDVRKSKDEKAKATAGQIAGLDRELQRSLNAATGDPNKAPDDLCKKLAQATVAIRGKKKDDFVRIARELLPTVRDYEQKRTPFGAAVYDFLLGNHLDAFDTIDFQCEALAEALKSYEPGKPNRTARRLVALIGAGRPGNWAGRWPDKASKPAALKVNAVVEKALAAQLDKGRFSPWLFETFRTTRRGSGWTEEDSGLALMERIIKDKALLKAGYTGDRQSVTSFLMYLVGQEFRKLRTKYPPETAFVDLFVEEILKTRYLDKEYWDQRGRDDNQKVANAAASILAGFQTLPLGYDGKQPAHTRADLWLWHTRALGAEKAARDKMLAAIEATYGKTRFDVFAMGAGYFRSQASVGTAEGRKAFFAKLAVYLDRARKEPARVSPPVLAQLKDLGDKAELTADELKVLIGIFPHVAPATWGSGRGYEVLPVLLHKGMVAAGRQSELYDLVPHFWKIARDTRDSTLQRTLMQYARDLHRTKKFDLAAAYSAAGLEVMGGGLAEDARSSLQVIRSKSVIDSGGVIPVTRADRRYPVFAAQVSFLTGKLQSAWELTLGKEKLVLEMFKDLDPNFCLWLIDKQTETREYEQAEAMARAMMQWFESSGAGFEPELRARLLLAYANVALARREFPRARAQFERIAAAKEFDTTRAQLEAELKVADVDRLTRQFDRAIERLEKLLRRRDKYIQTEAYYALSLVKYDQEEYQESRDYLDQVFAREPDHADARILQGRLYLKMKRLVEATELKVGLSAARRFIIPGRPLKVNLVDRNLSIVGKSTDVEIRAWTKSGDEEFFTLHPFGDSKTKFQGQVPTAMAPVQKGDRVLQLLGGDIVRYDFSTKFKEANRIVMDEPHQLEVVTDAGLYASSGRILSQEEREARALEQLIRRRLEEGQVKADPTVALSTIRADNQVKPGNSINVRIVDPDRATTAGKDTIEVEVTSSSGDRIASFTLVETETHSGIFEGAIPTASGQAVAFASDSEEGREPNHVICRKADYPAWVALPDNVRPKTFSVDLNDNVPLGKMTVRAGVPGRKLKKFLIQTSLNARDYNTIGAWPEALKPWDGSLRLEVMRFPWKNKALSSIQGFRSFVEQDYLAAGAKYPLKADSLEVDIRDNLQRTGDRMKLHGNDKQAWFVAHARAAFCQERRQVRTFRLVLGDNAPEHRYVLAIDGVQGSGENPLEVQRTLGKGVHVIEVFACKRRRGPDLKFSVHCDTTEPPFMAPCPAAMFDHAKYPQIPQGVAVPGAKVTANEEGSAFEIAFDPEARARVVRLLLADFETDAPAIEKITLADADGNVVLPTKEDFLDLRKNNVLEIVPGDRITVAYEDTSVITQGEEHHETFLTATYNNGTISASFVEYSEPNADGERKATYIPMRRFKPGDTLAVFMSDPDGDVSDKPDELKFTARIFNKKPLEFTALETEPHSGIFIRKLFPVKGEPKRPVEVQIAEGDDLILSYLDKENTDPGIPWNRTFVVEQTWYDEPQLRVFEVASQPLDETAKRPAASVGEGEELIEPRLSLVATWPETIEPEKTPSVVIGGPVRVEVVFPFIAQSPRSSATLYAQTSAGRKAYGRPLEGAFDIKVPGTIKLEVGPSNGGGGSAPPGYTSVLVRGNPFATDALDDGRFTFNVPVGLGKVPETTLAIEDPDEKSTGPVSLSVKGDDVIHIGFPYKDEQGAEHWITRDIQLTSDAFFDVMDRRYQEALEGVHVGEKVYVRVIHPSLDTTDEKDIVNVSLAAGEGRKGTAELAETFAHSGIFKGVVRVTYAGEQADEAGSFGAAYGDTITLAYAPAEGAEPLTRKVLVFKGADGKVLPFTKRFKDPAIAVQTQFTIAEAYFELAKRHRELGKKDLSREEIAAGKKTLEEALRDFPDTEARAQAEYLLANLSLEFAEEAEKEEEKKKFYMEAAARFSDLVASYPESSYAPKSQYKKALVFEKMGEIDLACEEYVKLSYRYPDNELVAETIARLGQYFLTKGKDLKEKAKPDMDPVEREKLHIESRDMFKTAGQVFGRLAVRFPDHRLAGRTSVLSAQCYMQAEELDKAVETFKKVIETPDLEPTVVSEAMYWCGDAYMRQDEYVEAYRMFKKLTWDYPASKWAKFARGRLTDEKLISVSENETE